MSLLSSAKFCKASLDKLWFVDMIVSYLLDQNLFLSWKEASMALPYDHSQQTVAVGKTVLHLTEFAVCTYVIQAGRPHLHQ